VKQPPDLPQPLLSVPHIQRDHHLGIIRFRKLLLEPFPQAFFAVDHDLHHLIRAGAKAATFRLPASPANRVMAAAETPPNLLVDRPVQFPVFPTPQRIHRHQRGTFAVFAVVPTLLAFLFVFPFALLAASMTLAFLRAAAAFLRALPRAAAGLHFGFGRGGDRFAVYFDDQHFAVILERSLAFHEHGGSASQTDHQQFDGLGGRRPSQHRFHQPVARRIADAGGRSRGDLDDPPTESVGRDSQRGIQRKPAVAFSASRPQVNPAEGHRSAERLDPARSEVSFDLPVVQPSGHIQSPVFGCQDQRHGQTEAHADQRPECSFKR